ncbi:MAG: dsDNA nuclease domain-containing protein [Candidatus Scalindua sp.]
MSKSIHDSPPLETGGTDARHGFGVQDHVAAGFCLEMLSDNNLRQVWCENQDDVTLIWEISGNEEIEFVQVKALEFNQLWSIALLCNREKKNGKGIIGTSYLERSLVYDQYFGKIRFRFITSRPVNAELKPLTYELNSTARKMSEGKQANLIKSFRGKIGDFRSLNGNDCEFWAKNTFWEEIYSMESTENNNIRKLSKIIQDKGEILFEDQIKELYKRLLAKVYEAGQIRWDKDPEGKKISKNDLAKWFQEKLNETVHPAVSGSGKSLSKKMNDACLPLDTIETAKEARLHYRKEILSPKYMQPIDIRFVEGEVEAKLLELRSQLDAGTINNSGIEFHALCLQELSKLRESLKHITSLSLFFLYGCMYNITDRCPHRFIRAQQ